MSSKSDQLSLSGQPLGKYQNDSLRGQQLLPEVVEGVLGSLGGKAFHNFLGDQLQVWQQISLATGPEVKSIDKLHPPEIDLKSFYVHQIQVAKETPGEYADAIRCVLIDRNGSAHGFASDGIASDLARLISAFGMGPYDPPIKIKVVPFETRRGRTAYSIQPQ